MQLFFLGSFFVLIVLYHLVHTFLGYGVAVVSPHLLSGAKDLLRLVVVLCVVITHYEQCLAFLRDQKKLLLLSCVLIGRSLGLSLFQGMSWGSIVVGFKYDIYPLLILVSGLLVGYLLAPQLYKWSSKKRLSRSTVSSFFLLLLGAGLLRQGSKLLFPEIFAWFGYGAIGDYVLGTAPPVWYRTGPGGLMRLQGLFSGPNNYGFFLVGITGLVVWLLLHHGKRREKLLLGSLFAVSLFWTLSRGAWIGAGVTVALTIWYYFPVYKKYLIRGGGFGLLGVVLMSLFKTGSTSGHRVALWEGMHAFLLQPRGYGLGMAGPSVHYAGVYLPENQYMQILLDLGRPGFVLRVSVFFVVFNALRDLLTRHQNELTCALHLLFFGLCGLFVEGLFLHVREDSMVNYLLLATFGLLLGYAKRNDASDD